MALIRYAVPVLLGGLICAAPSQLPAQQPTGSISGRVVDAQTQEPLSGVALRLEGTRREAASRADGGFTMSDVSAGTYKIRATRIGYALLLQDVTVTAGATANVDLALRPAAAILDAVVVTGYGTQRREAITGSVSTVDASTANVGVVTNVNNMIQGRAAGVTIIQNNGEPGSGAQVRIRGGTSISASNEPLYVIDGVPSTTLRPSRAASESAASRRWHATP
jgi:iron complex outermembrane receptor protein